MGPPLFSCSGGAIALIVMVFTELIGQASTLSLRPCLSYSDKSLLA